MLVYKQSIIAFISVLYVISFDKSRLEVYYQAIDDVVSVRDINSPTGQSIVSIILGEKEIEINSFTNVVGELKKGVPAMAVLCDGTAKIVVVCEIRKTSHFEKKCASI